MTETEEVADIYSDLPKKDLYEVGEIPPLGHVPKQMYAWAIRRERHGEPDTAMQVEVVDTPELDPHDVLVLVMAAGVNYNGVWASLGTPVTPFDIHKAEYHIAGSDASGVVWAVGDNVKRFKIGDEVVVHCNQDDGDDEECNGGDPMFSPSQRIWGYETPDGSFAQFTRVQAQQVMPRPKHLTWEESACYMLTLATAYRMLFGHRPHILRPGHNVLVWGASGGLGSMAIQLIATAGANAIGVISDDSKRDFVLELGAKGVINRKDFNCWGQLPEVNGEGFGDYMKETRKFGKAIWDITGKGNDVDFVFERELKAATEVFVDCQNGGAHLELARHPQSVLAGGEIVGLYAGLTIFIQFPPFTAVFLSATAHSQGNRQHQPVQCAHLSLQGPNSTPTPPPAAARPGPQWGVAWRSPGAGPPVSVGP